jgi:uncharacterized membrane protein YhhN
MNGLPAASFDRSLSRFTLLYALVALLELISNFLTESMPFFHYVAKPSIVLSLLIFYQFHARTRDGRLKYGVVFALFFSLLGDCLLMFSSKTFFLLGLGAFLMAHLCYIVAFSQTHNLLGERALLRRKPWLLFFFAVYFAILMVMVFPGLGPMRIPVLTYATVIMVMVLMALNRWKRVPQDSFSWVFLGALLFMLSDSLIAITRFGFPIPFSQTWIMLTYMAAQYLIVAGMLWQIRAPRPQMPHMN